MRAAIDGYADVCAWQLKLAKTGAWFAGMVGRWEKPPGLAELIGEDQPVQSGDDLAAGFAAWEAATAHQLLETHPDA